MKKIKVMTVFGTRPEAIKMAPLVLKLKKNSSFEALTVVTAQHREMLDQVLQTFCIQPDYDLNIMHANQTLGEITASVLQLLDQVIAEKRPDIILVHGDTTTTFAASMAAFYRRIPLGHVEAGLRTWNKYSPYPEEMNRQMTDVLSDLYFAPTKQSKDNLLKEGHPEEKIFITGNTAIDALEKTIHKSYEHDVLTKIDPEHKIVLLTMHRRENQGTPMKNVFTAVREVLQTHPDVDVIYPLHLNPKVRKIAYDILGNNEQVHLIEPLDVVNFHNLSAKSFFIMTDSGGVQEEAPALGKPVLVLRDTTERPEGVTAGTLKLVGTDLNNVKEEMNKLLDDRAAYKVMAEATNPYGDGRAAARIIESLSYFFGIQKKRPLDFQ
ncbi:non-hydrolyzing UDP-N-acetylglucosamine 2-epimerase [Liquorilactobacillus capillatus]|uniref:UDP-N-acetylglucosamine 2-epimerase (non-hydrolyzing) n=1 Tax=Liquorilactobacillus capillatus DSM 19910 TaxID=1423731 RepID=A0A0R1LXH1_9LACO|nr:UDP-N-acetylglucosamine 2-epimerase (non-hydrolyzing) [Liquorilactobacillus capillatus]KRL00272.1 UDP-N-acetylglucosamine 2-epimerase [Liquorilactobacillus capillatus DSM 19910]